MHMLIELLHLQSKLPAALYAINDEDAKTKCSQQWMEPLHVL